MVCRISSIASPSARNGGLTRRSGFVSTPIPRILEWKTSKLFAENPLLMQRFITWAFADSNPNATSSCRPFRAFFIFATCSSGE